MMQVRIHVTNVRVYKLGTTVLIRLGHIPERCDISRFPELRFVYFYPKILKRRRPLSYL